MPTAGKDVDITLSNTDGSTNLVGINLWRDNPALPGGWAVEHVNPDVPVFRTDEANYQRQSPDLGSVHDQISWHMGFGEGTCRGGGCTRYGYTDGALAMFENEIMPSYQEDDVDLIVRNGRFEWNATTGWTASDTTMAISSSAHTGNYGLQVTVTANNGTISQTYGGTVSVLRSRKVTLIAYARRTSGSGTCKARITDSAGSTDSSTVSSSSYAIMQVSRTLNAGATSLAFTLLFSADDDVWVVDDIAIVPEGGVVATGKLQEFAANAYIAVGRGIYKWDESNDYWHVVYMDASYSITSLISYGSTLLAGRNTNDNYLRSTDGTTWADPTTPTGNASQAEFFARGLNANGDWALFKSRSNQIALTTDPSNTANWGGEIQVGDPDRDINNLFSANGTVYAGREDGLMVYDEAINRFRDIEPEGNWFPEGDNYATGMAQSGSLYASGGEQTFWRITAASPAPRHVFEDLSYLFKAPAFRGFGGRVAAMAQDRNSLWVALADDLSSTTGEFPYSFPITFPVAGISNKVYLMAIRQQQEEGGGAAVTVAHTVTSMTVSVVKQISRFSDGERSSMFVVGHAANTDMSGDDTDEPRVIRLRMPIDNENPRHNSTRAFKNGGEFFTPWIDYSFPDVSKAQIKLTINSKNFDSNDYATVYYKKDDATDDDSSGWTVWGSDGIFNESPSETVAAVVSTLVTFTRIRFKIAFTVSSSTADPPVVTGIVLHSMWNPTEFRRFRAITRLADKRQMQLRRVRRKALRSADITSLNNLRQQPFVQMTDPDGTAHYVKLRYTDTMMGGRVFPTRNTSLYQTRALDLEMTEVQIT